MPLLDLVKEEYFQIIQVSFYQINHLTQAKFSRSDIGGVLPIQYSTVDKGGLP